MKLSNIWQALPGDVVELILEHHVDDYAGDPAYTWAVLRHVSAAQKRLIERRFEVFWLPLLNITLYHGTGNHFDYEFDRDAQATGSGSDGIGSGEATFSRVASTSPITPGEVMEAWAAYNPASCRSVTVRLGEGYLSGGCKGGYILNDTGLPGLEVLDGGESIRFRWKEAMDELLREELYIRRVGERLFEDACSTWFAVAAPSDSQDTAMSPPGEVQVQLWKLLVQIPRRVAGFRHRVEKSKTTPGAVEIELKFGAYSKHLHKQTPEPDGAEKLKEARCCTICSRRDAPDIFEVVSYEESVVPQLPIFRRWLEGLGDWDGDEDPTDDGEQQGAVGIATITNLYAEEFGWRCCVTTRKEDNLAWKERRANDARLWLTDLRSILVGKDKVRWNVMG